MAKNGTTSTNLAPNVASALCYVPFVGWIAALVLFIVEKNSTVRWNAVQSLLLTGALWLLGWVLVATLILALLSPIVMVGGLVINLVLAVQAYQGKTPRLPVLAGLADKVARQV